MTLESETREATHNVASVIVQSSREEVFATIVGRVRDWVSVGATTTFTVDDGTGSVAVTSGASATGTGPSVSDIVRIGDLVAVDIRAERGAGDGAWLMSDASFAQMIARPTAPRRTPAGMPVVATGMRTIERGRSARVPSLFGSVSAATTGIGAYLPRSVLRRIRRPFRLPRPGQT